MTVHFNINEVEHEHQEDFVALLGEGDKQREFHFIPPSDIDYQDLLQLRGNPLAFLNAAVREEEVNDFMNLGLKLWQANALVEAYYKHFPDFEDHLGN